MFYLQSFLMKFRLVLFLFLSYSLLLGVDEEKKQIACGLVDTIGIPSPITRNLKDTTRTDF